MDQTGLTEFSSPADDGAVDPEEGTDTRSADIVTAEAEAIAGSNSGSVDAVVDVDEARFPESTGTVEMMITQVDYTIEGSGSDEYPVIHVFGRTPNADGDDEPEHVRVLGVEPYFYVPTENLDFDPVEEYDTVIGVSETNTEGDLYESIRGRQVTRVVTRTPRDVGQVRDEFSETYEADILFPDRFLVDNGISAGMRVEQRRLDDGRLQVSEDHLEPADVAADIRVNTFDIEVEDRSGFPEDGEEPIVCLTSHDSYDDEYILWLYEAPIGDGEIPDGLSDYEPLSGNIDCSVRTFDKEAAMLDAFVSYIDDTSPDLTTGWNFGDFDMPYLLDRMEELNRGVSQDLSAGRLSRVDEVWRSGWGSPDVKGRVVFDLLYAYKRTMFTELESYRLDAVGERELDVGKERYPGDVGDLWEDDPERLLEYNLRDVELCVEIDRKQTVIEFWNEARKIVGCRIQDAPTPGDAVDMYVLHQAYGEFVLPTKGQRAGEEFEGGAVFDPITGVREMVSVLDLKCFSGDTEVATPSGLRNIQTLEIGDPVYTLNPDTLECEIKPVVDTQSYENQYGELHHVSGDTHDLKITENHRLLLSDSHTRDDLDPSDYELAEYRDLSETGQFAFPNHDPMPGATRDTFQLIEDVSGGHVAVHVHSGGTGLRAALPAGVDSEFDPASGASRLVSPEEASGKCLIPLETFRENRELIETRADEVFLKYDSDHAELPLAFEMDDWLELIGRFVTVGSVTETSPGIFLQQQDADGRRHIESLLDRLQLDYSADANGYTVSDRYLSDWFSDNCVDNSAQTQLPEWVFELDASHLQTLLDAVIAGEKSCTERGLREFWTESDQLKAGVVRLAIRCGEKPIVSEQSDGSWNVSIGDRGSMQKATATTEPHDGDVHCITAKDNHVVLAGRNGFLQWVGQSLYPMSMVTINASPETIVDNPEAYDGETYRAPDGTRFRKEPDGMMREMVDELLVEREELKGERNQHDPNSELYEKYDRQQQSVKVIMNCFTPDTDVLTPDGIRSITELGVGDEVYSLDPDSMEMEVKPVEETHAYPEYRDEVIDIETNGTDLRVTPNHRMLVRNPDQTGDERDDYQFIEAGDLDDTSTYHLPHDWEGPDGERIDTVDLTEFVDGDYQLQADTDENDHPRASEVGSTPETIQTASGETTGDIVSGEASTEHNDSLEETWSEFLIRREPADKWIPREYDGDDFLELLARYITDGAVCASGSTDSGQQLHTATIRLESDRDNLAATDGGTTVESRPSSQERVGRLLNRLGLEYHVDETSHQFTSRLLAELLGKTCGDDARTKQIPEFIFETSRRQKRAFLESIIHGDEHRNTPSWRYSTASEKLRDDILRLCAHLGMTANYTQDDGGISRISVSEEGEHTLRMDRDSATLTADDGVYCVTVADNHTLLAGRNGSFQFVGQSLYGVSGWEQFRLYDKDNAAAITAMGRRVIEFTEEAANEIDYDVTYGDSVTGERPLVVRDADGRVRILPAADLFERADRRDTLAITADGGTVEGTSIGKEYASLPEWEALSLADDGTAEWQPITEVMRHETDDEVVTLQHELGESTTTTDHSYVVSEDGEFVERPPDAVSEPLRIPDVPPVETVETIDLYELLNEDIREYVDGGTVRKETDNHLAKRVHSDGEHIRFGQRGHDDADNSIKLQREIDLTGPDGRSFVRLLAASIAYRSTSTQATAANSSGVSIAESRPGIWDERQIDSDWLVENTQLGSTSSDASDERTVTNQTQSETAESMDDEMEPPQEANELLAVVFREFAEDPSGGTQIPSFVYHLEDDLQGLFVETLIEGESTRESPRTSDEDTDRFFEFETPSRELAAGLSLLLTQREYDHALHYCAETDGYRIQPSDHDRSGREPVLTERDYDGYVYDLSVAENENFIDGVGGLVLHNTDSVMLSLPDVGDDSVEIPEPVREAHPELSESELETTQAAIDASENIESYINDRYDEFASGELDAEEHRFQIEFEKLYRRFFQAGKKKRYAGHIVWKEGKHVDDVDITGFEYQRSDIAGITKRVQREVIDRIVTGEDLEADLDGVKSFLGDEIDAFLEGNMPLDEVGIPGGIGKRLGSYKTDTAQVRGAKYANLLFGTNFGRGSKPKRLYLDSVHPDFWHRIETEQELDPQSNPLYGEFKREVENGDGVICFEYADQIPEEFNVDWEKMLEKTLKRPISRVIEAVGTSWEEVKTGKKQSGLEQYF